MIPMTGCPRTGSGTNGSGGAVISAAAPPTSSGAPSLKSREAPKTAGARGGARAPPGGGRPGRGVDREPLEPHQGHHEAIVTHGIARGGVATAFDGHQQVVLA